MFAYGKLISLQSGDQSLEMYQTWCLEPSELSTETLWSHWEEFLQVTSQ